MLCEGGGIGLMVRLIWLMGWNEWNGRILGKKEEQEEEKIFIYNKVVCCALLKINITLKMKMKKKKSPKYVYINEKI